MDYLVGSTGFVGSNLLDQHPFDGQFHSTDVGLAYGKEPDLLVYAGVRAEMFTANRSPEADRQEIEKAIQNIRQIRPKECVLISTIAVYPDPQGVDESTVIEENGLNAYGANRLALERWVEENVPHSLIVRLPAIYGKGLRKNFLYDYIHVIPALLTKEKRAELIAREPKLDTYYISRGDGYYRCREISETESDELKAMFRRLGFSALNFTDSRSVYQFFSLKHLWKYIEKARRLGLRRFNLATPPLSAGEVFRELSGESFENKLNKPPYHYDMRSRYAELFSGSEGYIMSREQELKDIKTFVQTAGGRRE